ncbi:MAG: discoidin domain-containing protein [Ruminococcaceae bacterium]|nr:discoidin domain-containing protein [Oscillospiraceae bacterium]
MERKLSFEKIDSYVGDVLPLRLLGDEDFSKEDITWKTDDPCVQIKTYVGKYEASFTNGVLLTLLYPGKANVTATFNGVEYTCPVSIHERRTYSSDEEFNYYIGDFHDHTCNIHNRKEFSARGPEIYPAEYIKKMKSSGLMDFGVVSDHAGCLNPREYFRGFADAYDAGQDELILFPGAEAEVASHEEDRFGVFHKNSGEIVTVNAQSCTSTHSWKAFFDDYSMSPYAISCLAHPQIIGHSCKGVWNFRLTTNTSPRFRQMVRLVEIGDGTDRQANLLNEFTYSVALDAGFKVCPTCSSDAHGPVWGFERFPGKTIIMAKEKTKEAFYDAILSNRLYASSTGNVKIRYTVNGKTAPATLPFALSYDIHVDIGYLRDEPDTVIKHCQVISNGGMCVAETEGEDLRSLDFHVESNSACYFFLRMWDAEGRKTWSCPVWTGREPVYYHNEDLLPMEKEGFTVTELENGKDASVLINNDVHEHWMSEGTTATLLMDLQEVKTVHALGVYHRILSQKEIKAEGLIPPDKNCEFPSEYVLSASVDNEEFKVVSHGRFRVFSAEEMIRITPVDARYLKLEILTTVGKECQREKFVDAKIAIAELTPFYLRPLIK